MTTDVRPPREGPPPPLRDGRIRDLFYDPDPEERTTMTDTPTTTADRPSADYTVWMLDFDGTVRHGYDELGRFVNGPEDVTVFPEVPALLRGHTDADGTCIGITNQAGVALGYMTTAVCAAAVAETRRQCALPSAVPVFTSTVVCTHAPDSDCWCRKPSPGGIILAMSDLAENDDTVYGRDDVLVVGDRPEDAEAAARAGCAFRLASEWRAGR